MVSAAPDATFRTTGVTPTLLSTGITTASAATASADRRQAPRLWGSWISSSTNTNKGRVTCACRDSITATRSVIGSSGDSPLKTATTPWCCTSATSASRVFLSTSAMRKPLARAKSNTARSRESRRPRCTSTRSIFSGADLSSALTLCIPPTCCSVTSAYVAVVACRELCRVLYSQLFSLL